MKVKLETDKIKDIIKDYSSDRDVGNFVAMEMYRMMIPFTPMDTGMLYQNVVIEPFRVTYNQPYARRLYYGEDFNFSHEKHPNARAEWALGVDKNQLARNVAKYIATRGGR